MRQHTSTTADARVQVGSLWIDRATTTASSRSSTSPTSSTSVCGPCATRGNSRRATSRRPRSSAPATSGCGHDPRYDASRRGASRSGARACNPARPRGESQGRRRAARRGHPRGARPPAREGVPLPDHAVEHARGSARARRRVHRWGMGLPDARRDPPEVRAMSATKAGRGLASPDSRRRPRAKRSKPPRVPLFDRDARSAPGSPAGGTHRVTDPQLVTMPKPEFDRDTPPEPWGALQRAQRARPGDRSLWQNRASASRDAPRRSDLRAARRWSAGIRQVHGARRVRRIRSQCANYRPDAHTSVQRGRVPRPLHRALQARAPLHGLDHRP